MKKVGLGMGHSSASSRGSRGSRPRIGIAGIAIESSTFSPHRTGLDDFVVTTGADLLARYSWLSASWAREAEWVPLLHAVALPGGAVESEVYQRLKSEILRLAAAAVGPGQSSAAVGQLDGLFLDIHGAM